MISNLFQIIKKISNFSGISFKLIPNYLENFHILELIKWYEMMQNVMNWHDFGIFQSFWNSSTIFGILQRYTDDDGDYQS